MTEPAKNRGVRITDTVYDAAKAAAIERGTRLSRVVSTMLEAFNRVDDATWAALSDEAAERGLRMDAVIAEAMREHANRPSKNRDKNA